jgi:hypothetical protein
MFSIVEAIALGLKSESVKCNPILLSQCFGMGILSSMQIFFPLSPRGLKRPSRHLFLECSIYHVIFVLYHRFYFLVPVLVYDLSSSFPYLFVSCMSYIPYSLYTCFSTFFFSVCLYIYDCVRVSRLRTYQKTIERNNTRE